MCLIVFHLHQKEGEKLGRIAINFLELFSELSLLDFICTYKLSLISFKNNFKLFDILLNGIDK